MIKKNDDGVTLIELLVAVAIMGMLFTAIAGVALVVFSSKTRATEALQNSNDTQIVTTYFGDDVSGMTNNPPMTDLRTADLVLMGTDWGLVSVPNPTGVWTHTYQLNTTTHVLTRDTKVIALNVWGASFTPPISPAVVWTLSLKGCVVKSKCASGVTTPTTITATRRI
jgi:prepilin-type N-terminal cleavage/methylation domain-containing protein